MKLSAALDKRLDDLVSLVNDEGNLVGHVYRHDLIAALVAFAPEESSELEKLMTEYAEMTVRDALVGDAKNAKVIEFPSARPGRRAH
jgi:hypothetical protein